MRNFRWSRFPIKNLLIDSLLAPIVVSTYLNRDMCKFESSRKDESRWQSTDSSEAYRKTSAFKWFSSGDNTRARKRMPERNHAIKQSVTVHEKSRKAEPFNVHWKRAMKLIFSYFLFQTQLFW